MAPMTSILRKCVVTESVRYPGCTADVFLPCLLLPQSLYLAAAAAMLGGPSPTDGRCRRARRAAGARLRTGVCRCSRGHRPHAGAPTPLAFWRPDDKHDLTLPGRFTTGCPAKCAKY